jgi:hypothetical protein
VIGSGRSAIRVAASVNAKVARSASLNERASRQAATVAMRSSDSPALRSSRVCISTQKLHPLIWLARSSTILSVVYGTPVLEAETLSPCRASIAPGTIITGCFMRGPMLIPFVACRHGAGLFDRFSGRRLSDREMSGVFRRSN